MVRILHARVERFVGGENELFFVEEYGKVLSDFKDVMGKWGKFSHA